PPPPPRRAVEQRPQMVDVRVDAAVRHEAEQVDVPLALVGPLERRHERLVLEERAVLDRLVDAHQVLEEDATRADREVADLRVPHLAGRQPHRLAGCPQRRMRVALPERVEDLRLRELDGVAGPRRRQAPAVEDDERDALPHASVAAAARQIDSKAIGSSDAPPTSAPSTAGCASREAALSAFTEPP